ncbi:MAG: type VI secretion system tip protein TssI/VgrG [Pseudomonadota bacterium]
MAGDTELVYEGRSIRLKGPLPAGEMQFFRAKVKEGLGQFTEITVEFLSTNVDIKLEDVIGQPMSIEIDTEGENIRYYAGHCIEILFEGTYMNQGHYCATLRSWPWMLTRTADCRIFQDKSSMDIIKKIFGEYNFSDFEDKTQTTYKERVYCVQYRETDWDFIYRLMIEDGIYFYFDYEEKKDKMVLVASSGSHSSIKEKSDVEFHFRQSVHRQRGDHIYEWRSLERMHTGKTTLNDYDFKNSTSDLKSANAIETGKHNYKAYENYDWHGRYEETSDGDKLARVRMEALKAGHQRAWGEGSLRTMAVGYRFKLKDHPREAANQEYLIVDATHLLQIDDDSMTTELQQSTLGMLEEFDHEKHKEPFRVMFQVQPAQTEYRIPYPYPRPTISGLQTAKVMGPSGDEIYTDEHGRVKVKFHWDRNPEGKPDESLTCWIRTSVPWSGKNWGQVWVPRVGQEVVVQFEEGDPDRPLIVGMLYNDATMHPYALPANMTQMGWTTRSTKGGGTDTFHELVFEDKKDSEFVRFQSERDYKQIVKNNAEITIGIEHADAGDFTQTIKNNRTETVQEGDHTFTVETGNETYTVESNREMTVNGDHSETVAGSQTIDVTGAISITSQDSITLTVGGSSITIDQTSIKIESTQIEVTAQATATISASGSAELSSDGMITIGGSMVEVGGDAMVIVDGGVCMIN